MPLHDRANWEYAGHCDFCKENGPELRPIPDPIPPLPGPFKSKRPARQPDAGSALGASRGYRAIGRDEE